MKPSPRTVLATGFGLAIAVLIANAIVAYRNVHTLAENDAREQRALRVLAVAERVISLLKDAETGHRGYLVTGDPAYLVPYRAAVGGTLDSAIVLLRSLSADEPEQLERIARVERESAAMRGLLRESLARRQAAVEDFAPSRRLMDRAKERMDGLRVLVGEIEDAERRGLAARRSRSEASLARTLATVVLATLGALALLAGLFAYANRSGARLFAEKERLRVTLLSIGDAVIATDPLGRVVLMNPVAESLCGWDLAEARGRPLAEVFAIVHEQTRAPAEDPVARVLREGKVVGLANHTALIDRGGAERPIEDSAAPILGARGEVDGVILVFHDVSDRRTAEREARQGEQRFRTLAEALPQMVWVTDSEGRAEYFNARWTESTGLTPERSVGWGWADALHPDDRERTETRWAEAIGTGQPYEIEYRLGSADRGHRWFLARGLPQRDGDGRITRWIGTCTDIEDRRRAEEATSRRAAQLKELADVASRLNAALDVPSVLGVLAEEARRLVGARRAAAEIEPEAGAGPVAAAAGEPPTAPELAAAVERRLRRVEVPLRLPRPDFGEGWLAAPLIGRGGRGLGSIRLAGKRDGDFSDDDEAIVAQLAQMAAVAIENAILVDELRANDRAKNEFLAMLAHELRNPLAAIGNAVALSGRAGDDPDQSAFSREVMGRQIRNLSRLIEDLLDVSRISRGKIELRCERIDLAPILVAALETVRPLVEERKHTLESRFEAGSLFVDADPTRLEQVVTNLLNNAAKYSENGGAIRLEARREGPEIAIVVADSGVGIAPEQLPRMFELFAQGDRSLARSEGGLGIGLTLVKTLTELHGGRVTAASPGLGQGSEFVVRLPAADGPPAASAGGQPASPIGRPGSRVLVVDDNLDTARGLARLLKLLGHEVRTAHGGPEALVEARGFAPDVVLLDIGLPGMSGYEVATALRTEPALGPDLTIIAVSGYGQEEERRRSREAGFDYHLVKPVDHETLLALLARSAPAGPPNR